MRLKAMGWRGMLWGGAVLAGMVLQGASFCAAQTGAPAKASPAAGVAAAAAPTQAASPAAAVAAAGVPTPAGAATTAGSAPKGAVAMSANGPVEKRGPNDRYYAIQQVLDSGGTFYLYADTKDALKQYIGNVQTAFSGPQMPPQFTMGFIAANQVIDRLGLYGIQDLGVSTVADGDMNRTKVFVVSADGRSKGILSLLGGDPHPIKMLDRVPADTELLFTADVDPQATWALVRQMVQEIVGAAGVAQMDQGLAQFTAQSGIDIAAIVPSLGGEVAIVGSQNPAEKMTLPTGTANTANGTVPKYFSVDSPRIGLMVRVTKDDLYQGLKQAFAKQGATAGAEATEGKLRYVAIAGKPNPAWPVTPVLATDGEYVYFATHLDYMKTLAAGAGPGLRGSDEFKQLSTGLPTDANGCTFVSARLQKALLDVLQALTGGGPAGVGANPAAGPDPNFGRQPGGMVAMMPTLPLMMMKQSLEQQGGSAGSLTVRVNRPDGILIVNRSKGNAASIVPAMAMAPAAILAAIAVPNFLEAQTRAKVARVRADTRSMATAIEAFNIDMNKYPPSSPDPAQNLFGAAAAQRSPALNEVSTFQLVTYKSLTGSNPPGAPGAVGVAAPGGEPLVMPLTTPVCYITRIPNDVFAPAENVPLCYFRTVDNKYVIWSAGPDGQYDLTTEDVTRIFAATNSDPRQALEVGVGAKSGRAFTYDPSNGTTSAGDLWYLTGGFSGAAAAPRPVPGVPGGPGGPGIPGLPGGNGGPTVGLPGGMR